MSALRETRARDLVIGLGATGLSVARYLSRNHLDAVFSDTRETPPGIDELREIFPRAELILGDVHLPEGTTRVIASPGIADKHPLLTRARRSGIPVISDIELFVDAAQAPFMAITGSNGKSTVTTLLAYMCTAAGYDVRAGGNLGKPALDLLIGGEPEGYVLELSSFQLQRTQHLPADVAVLLNISPDHLDWHDDENQYREAKYRIFREAKAAVYNRADPQAAVRAANAPASVSFGMDEPPEGQYGLRNVEGETFLARGDTLLISTRELALFGRHNQANALAALAAGDLAGIDLAPMLEVLSEFPGLPHRMQFVDRVRSVDYVNDSKATNVAAAVASVESVEGMLVLIAGGVGKGTDYRPLGEALEDKLRAAVLIGDEAANIESALDTIKPVYIAEDMQEAVAKAAEFAEKGDTVLLAPACASFDMFENYGARGEAFSAAVRELRK